MKCDNCSMINILIHQSINQSNFQSNEQPINQSINQTFNQTNRQSINQSINQTFNQTNSQSIKQASESYILGLTALRSPRLSNRLGEKMYQKSTLNCKKKQLKVDFVTTNINWNQKCQHEKIKPAVLLTLKLNESFQSSNPAKLTVARFIITSSISSTSNRMHNIEHGSAWNSAPF